jgi:N utilization substance protein B
MTPEPSEQPESPTPENEQPPATKKRSKRRRPAPPAGFAKNAYVDMSGARHQSRIIAMQSLYERDLTDHELDEILARIRGETVAPLTESALASMEDDENDVEDIPQPVAERAIALIEGVLGHQGEIDPMIEKAAPQFPIPQIAAIDRNVLRLAIYELHHSLDVPYKVVINEAVEIAKRFGGPSSGRFVNGVLGTISKTLPDARKR